jgi:hypothetical protein
VLADLRAILERCTDEAALYTDSVTAMTMGVGLRSRDVECCLDYSGNYLTRLVSGERAQPGARHDAGTMESLAEQGVLSGGWQREQKSFHNTSYTGCAGVSLGEYS